MTNIRDLNEATIKRALQDGYITKEEARQMLMVYLQKANFSPMKYPAAHNVKTSFSNRY